MERVMSGHRPNIAYDLLLSHSIITRAIKVSNQHVKNSIEDGNLNESTRIGFLNYLQSLSSVLAIHHRLETEIAFPYLQNKISEAPYEMLNKQHKTMQTFLNKINNVINHLNDKNNDFIL